MELLRDKVKRETYMVSKLSAMVMRGDLRENHPLQRKAGQWGTETRDNLIVSVILNEDIDPVKICEQLTFDGIILWLIDGLQRSTTIADYKAGRFSLGRNINPSTIRYQECYMENGERKYRNVEFDLRGKGYKDLPEKLKEDFDNCPIEVVKHLDCTDEEIGRHICRYNSGKAMCVAQKTVAYMYKVAKDVKNLSSHAFFNDCANYSATKDKNGSTDKVVSECVMALNFFDKWDKAPAKIGRYLNENADVEMFDKVENYLDRLLEVVTPETGVLFSPKNAVVWMMAFDKFNNYGLSDEKFQEFLEEFCSNLKNKKVKVNHDYELEKNSNQRTDYLSFSQLDGAKSTKDKGIISDKLLIIETVMNEFFGFENTNSINTEDIVNESEADEAESANENENEVENNIVDFVSVDVVDFISNAVDLPKEAVEEDLDFFEDDAQSLIDNVINFSSKLLEHKYKVAIMALVAYSYKNDVLLDEWLSEYSMRKDIPDSPKDAYYHMVINLKREISVASNQ